MSKQPHTAYSVLFRNEDGSLRGTIPGSTPECAIRAANPLEGQDVFGFAAIRVEPGPISGMRFVLREVGPKAEPVARTQQPSPQADEVRGEACAETLRMIRDGGLEWIPQVIRAFDAAIAALTTPEPQGDAQ